MTVPIETIEQDGQLWINARGLIAALRDRASRWDAEAGQPTEGYPVAMHETACWAASGALERSADELDLQCLELVNEEPA